jgi:hypothetical protein
MRGLTVPRREYVGRFRGEVGLEGVEVEIAGVRGTPAVEVANELSIFERKLRAAVVVLDAQYPERRTTWMTMGYWAGALLAVDEPAEAALLACRIWVV